MPKTRVFIIIGFFFLAISCGKDDNGSTQPPPSPVDAPISGQVKLYNESVIEEESSGMSVIVDSTFPPQKAVSGADGKFIIPYIGFGKTTLIFEKAGYGTFKIFNIDHNYNSGLGTVITPVLSLGKISTTTITVLNTSVSAGSVAITVMTSPAGTSNVPKYVRLFLHSRAGVSNVLYQKALDILVANTNPLEKVLTKAELNALGFASGTTVYVRAYGESFHSNNYDDLLSGRMVYPNLNLTTVAAVSFIVP